MRDAPPILVTGATGLVGSRLLPGLLAAGSSVRILSRRPARVERRAGVEAFGWDGVHPPSEALAGAGAVVHLSGEPVFGGLPSRAHLERVRASRIDSTRALVGVVAALPAGQRPSRLVCASAVGIYGEQGETPLPEDGPTGRGFLADLCRDWEAAAAEARGAGLRVASLRIGVVLARGGGALALLARLFGLGLGGRVGSGRQWMPWVHVDDVVGGVRLALDDASVSGPVNCVAPEPVRNAEFTRTLASVLHRPAVLPAPAFALRAVLGPVAAELLDSRRVEPALLRARGYAFRQPTLRGALEAELGGARRAARPRREA